MILSTLMNTGPVCLNHLMLSTLAWDLDNGFAIHFNSQIFVMHVQCAQRCVRHSELTKAVFI